MRFEELPTLLAPERLPYLSGVERLADGVLHVAVLTRMPGVSPEMIRWWFGEYMQTSEDYKRWHPRDHVWMDWEDKRPRNGSRFPEAIANAPWVRRKLARMPFGRALAVHCHEEMSTLAGFLPDLYVSES